MRPPPRGDPSWRASHLEEDVGAGAVEAVGPGVERGHEGAAFQGAGLGAGPLFALPAPHGALAGGGRGPRVAGAPQGVLGQQRRLPQTLEPPRPPMPLSSPGAAGVGSDRPGGVGHTAERAGALGDGHAGEVFGNVIENQTCRRELPGAVYGDPAPPGASRPVPQEGLSPCTPPVPCGLHAQPSAPSCRQAPAQGPPPPSGRLGPPPRGYPSLPRGVAHVAMST